MGKASRGKQERSRDNAGQWTATSSAGEAHRLRELTQQRLTGNPWVQMTLADNINNVVTELHAVLLHSDLADMADAPEGIERDAAWSMTLGKQGHRPPWPRTAGEAASWEIRQIQKLLRQAEVLVISPAAHAAVMAAAATLEPADISTLDRDRDILVSTGLLVLPEPIVVVNHTGSLSDTRAFGWQFVTQHQMLPTARYPYPGVQVTTFMDRDGPVQPTGWRQAVSQARRSGSPLPPLMPDGMYGMRGDACLAEESTEMMVDLSERHWQMQKALTHASQWRREPVPETGEWGGGRVDDPYDDFVGRYMFAFWRLNAQGVTAADSLQTAAGVRAAASDADGYVPRDPDVRVIRLAAPSPRPSDPAGDEKRVYHHRWPVRMHKVRQWYPSLQEHRVIWRGPYIKGPADAPLMMGEKAYLVDS
ncbi:hypothetical protein M2163_001012 [Streptomyces sp. SAI-135]|uniref:hypothetical protein n=1 Tax=unclassified Streptomyces TaxID=2593676 RepID=UPI002473359C|nr:MULTISPECIES: hypothetical protein [unclassified Streptomyces]MDH6521993.1 hypothetical protein [Streptomyces sp. SAI-090]MDH6573362.1 hypothetical protein [Streptomyces sp. SAI-117]MDH6613904.1 hypothetical protein [Streptomyces sp. SAI-135]